MQWSPQTGGQSAKPNGELPNHDLARIQTLEEHGFNVDVVHDPGAALNELIDRIPADTTIMNGHSTTLEEIGFIDYLVESDHDWRNLHDEISPEQVRRRVRVNIVVSGAPSFWEIQFVGGVAPGFHDW